MEEEAKVEEEPGLRTMKRIPHIFEEQLDGKNKNEPENFSKCAANQEKVRKESSCGSAVDNIDHQIEHCLQKKETNDLVVSVNYGIYLCKECAAEHKSKLFFFESYIKTLYREPWDAYQTRNMMNGGNSKFYKFICEYGLNEVESIEERYRSDPVNYYMRRLSSKSTKKFFKEVPPPKNFTDKLMKNTAA